MNEQQIRFEMALHQAVEWQLDLIVQSAIRVVKLLRGGSMRENQLRNVLNVALNTESLELVGNFIRYQIGRSKEKQDWQYNNFGEKVIAELRQGGPIDHAAMAATAAVLAVPDLRADQDDVHRHVHIMLVRRFLGELNRAFLYADRTGGWKELEPILEPVGKPAAVLAGAEGGR